MGVEFWGIVSKEDVDMRRSVWVTVVVVLWLSVGWTWAGTEGADKTYYGTGAGNGIYGPSGLPCLEHTLATLTLPVAATHSWGMVLDTQYRRLFQLYVRP